MIFVDPTIEASQELFALGVYFPTTHEQFKSDGLSKAILNIKYRHGEDPDSQPWKQRNKTIALAAFHRKLNPMLAQGIAITAVPPHDPASSRSGIQELAQKLAANGRTDATGCLVRWVAIPKLATGGDRAVEQHLRSIRVETVELIRGREVLLLDDVSTSGGSLEACKQLLMQAGAAAVKCAVLGRTVGR
ncbi:MAG TPA: phosphoribosyltransferase family protein [Pyrinomonadaceae bacterium]|jgi:predicted amidophosphoribosyltransferase|nr:phosphoribosyltransferase family protein [Pyrinomonadaceae bacterium]